LFTHGVLENQIQGLPRTMSTFKDFQGLENQKKTEGLSRTGKSPVHHGFKEK